MSAGLVLSWTVGSLPASAQEKRPAEAEADPRCGALFEEAVGQLAAEQYPKMRKVAQDRMLLCPDPVSSFLLGLAEANMVDGLLGDRGQREQLRRSALRHLRVAAAGQSALRPEWLMTSHEWIVHLSRQGGVDAQALDEGDEHWSDEDDGSEDDHSWTEVEIPPAPPPQPQPQFPWGPVVTLLVGAGSLATGLVLELNAEAKSDDAKRGARELHTLRDSDAVSPEQLAEWAGQTRRLQEEAEREGAWGTGLIVGGGAALVLAGVWYWLLEPEGHWRWAATPAGLQTTVRF